MTQEIVQVNSIFRTNAINNQRTQDGMHASLRVIMPGSWLWIGTALTFMFSLLLWVTCGQVTMHVAANGIILPENSQVIPILALHQGRVTRVNIESGKHVAKGTLLAEISNPYIDADLKYLNTIYTENEKLLYEFKAQYNRKRINLDAEYQQNIKLLNEKLITKQEKTTLYKDLFLKKQALYKKRYLTIPELEKGKEDYITAKDELDQLKSDVNAAPLKYRDALNDLDEKIHQYLSRFLTSKHDLDTKILEKQNGSMIVSAEEGEVIATNISKGDYITTGKSLFTLITNYSNQSLDSLVFVSHAEGKKISAGMDAYILPSSLSAYEYGYIKGEVISVSEYPASKESVYAYLGNMNLVDEYFSGGVPFIAKIRLKKSTQTTSQLAWTTRHGAPFKIMPGTSVTVKIINKKCTPLQLLTSHNG